MEGPIECPVADVEEAWIDFNGHMNMAYYNLVFDRACDYVYDQLGIGIQYVQSSGGSCFTREVHVNFLQELVIGDSIRTTFQLLDWDPKRLHFFQEMYNDEDGYLAATSEQLAMHVDMNERRATEFPEVIQDRLRELMASHEILPRAPQIGTAIGIRR